MNSPIRPVSDEHRHEPADYELEPNELAACPNPWCASHKRPERGYVPFISKNRASSELRVACPVCPMSGPWADTEAEARKAWNQRSSLATRPDTKPTGDMREALEAADYEWRGPYGQEKHRIIPPVLFDRILTALTQAPRSCCADEREIVDDFNGDNAALKSSIAALLSFDRDGKIVPHGIGGHAHKLLSAAYRRLS